MHQLAQVASVQPILLQVQEALRQRGEVYASIVLAGRSEPVLFDVMTGISFTDHGQAQRGMRCQACPTGHGLRYEFQIEDVTGERFGPVGSNCVFTRALGVDQAKTMGRTLETGVRAYWEHLHHEEQATLLAAAGNWRAYLRRLGFEWVLLALVEGGGGLSPDLRLALTEIQDKKQILSLKHIGTLRKLTDQRQEVPERTAPSFQPSSPLPAPGRFLPLATADSPAGQSRPALRPRPAAGRAMSPNDWSTHVVRNRLEPAVQNWEVVASLLEMSEDEKKDLKRALDGRRPLKPEVMALLKPAMRVAGMPEQLPEPPRTPVRLSPEERLQAVRDRRHQQEQQSLQEQQSPVAVSSPVLIALQKDPLYPALKEDWNLIAPMIADNRRSSIARALNTGFIREDDYQRLLDVSTVVTTPQVRMDYQSDRYFLQYLKFTLGKAGVRWDSELQQLGTGVFEQGAPLSVLAPFLNQYVRGEAIHPQNLLSAAQLVIARFQERCQEQRSQPASKKTRTDVVRSPEVQFFWDAWGRGLAEAVQERERRLLGNALKRGEVSGAQLKRLTEAWESRSKKGKVRRSQEATGAGAEPKEPTLQMNQTSKKRTPNAFAAALCTEFERNDQDHLRRKLVAGSLSRLAQEMPVAFAEFGKTGQVTQVMLVAAAKLLE